MTLELRREIPKERANIKPGLGELRERSSSPPLGTDERLARHVRELVFAGEELARGTGLALGAAVGGGPAGSVLGVAIEAAVAFDSVLRAVQAGVRVIADVAAPQDADQIEEQTEFVRGGALISLLIDRANTAIKGNQINETEERARAQAINSAIDAVLGIRSLTKPNEVNSQSLAKTGWELTKRGGTAKDIAGALLPDKSKQESRPVREVNDKKDNNSGEKSDRRSIDKPNDRLLRD